MTWNEALALWALDMLPADLLPDAAALALQQGFDGRVTRQLAGASPRKLTESPWQFSNAICGCSLRTPPRIVGSCDTDGRDSISVETDNHDPILRTHP